jgi:hypothetical protein
MRLHISIFRNIDMRQEDKDNFDTESLSYVSHETSIGCVPVEI